MVAWNVGAVTYLLLVAQMVTGSSNEQLRRRAMLEDEGRWGVLVLTVLGAAAAVLAVGTQLAAVKEMADSARLPHIGLAVLTVLSSWATTQTLFALHYAHDFYAARAHHHPDPLSFPGTAEPTYLDFIYFACVIGTSGQTADVAFQGSGLRGVGTLHCVLAFFFNVALLGLTINIVAGLMQP